MQNVQNADGNMWFMVKQFLVFLSTRIYCITVSRRMEFPVIHHQGTPLHSNTPEYRVRINYRRISLRRNLSRKCHKIVKFVSVTHSERNIWNGPIVATAISREKPKPVLERNGCLTNRA